MVHALIELVAPTERNVISLSASRVSNTDNEKRNTVNTVQLSGIFAVWIFQMAWHAYVTIATIYQQICEFRWN